MLRLCLRHTHALRAAESKALYSLYPSRHLWHKSRGLRSGRGSNAPAIDVLPPQGEEGPLLSTRTVSIIKQPSTIDLTTASGAHFALPLLLLRDSCPCKTCRHEDTHQRLVDTFKLPSNPVIENIETSDKGLEVTWELDSHQSLYPWTWLSDHLQNQESRNTHKSVRDSNGNLVRYKHWDESIASNPPTVSYDEVMSSASGVSKWTSLIRTHGFSMIEGCPATPEATEKLLERIAFIRATHYGAFWDFTSDLRSKDTAYTSLSLEAHTDTNYFKDPAGLQMFHMLSHTDGEGGESLFVDGYKAATVLAERSPALYKTLQENEVLYECKGNDDVMLHARWPVLPRGSVPSDGNVIGPHDRMAPIRWNNSDRASVAMKSTAATEQWYDAAREFDSILKDPALEYWIKLKPGTSIIFDNYRVLHGRAAFTGKRRLCGGYINAQDFLSRWKTLCFSHDTLLAESPRAE